MAHFTQLSFPLQKYILSFCDADELFICGQVQKKWYDHVSQEDPWYTLSALDARRAIGTAYTYHSLAEQRHKKSHGQAKRPLALQFAQVPYITETYHSTQQQQHDTSAKQSSEMFNPFATADEGEKDATYGGGSEGDPLELTWVPTIQCPIPPPPQSASLGHEFHWTSIARQFDGGHGGAREYYMRCLRYFRFSPQSTYGTYLGQGQEDEAEEETATSSSSRCASGDTSEGDMESGYVSPAPFPSSTYGSSSGFMSGHAEPPPPQQQQQYAASNLWNFEPTPNPVVTTATPPLWGGGYGGTPSYHFGAGNTSRGQAGGADLLDELFAPLSQPPRQQGPVNYNPFEEQQLPAQVSSTKTEQIRGGDKKKRGKMKDRGAGQEAAAAAARQARMSSCYECKCLRRSFEFQPCGGYCKLKGKSAEESARDDGRVGRKVALWLLSPNRFCLFSPSSQTWSTALLSHIRLSAAQRRDRQRAHFMDRQQREETQDGSEGLFQGRSMSLSFKVGLHGKGERGGAASCFIGIVEASQAHRFQLQPTAASLAKRKNALLREQSNPSYGGGNNLYRRGGGGATEEDDEAASMIAALAEDIQSKEHAETGDAKYENARRWWSAPPPASSSHNNPNTDYNTRSGNHKDDDDSGGVFIGDCPGSYGLDMVNGYLHQNGAAYYLADPKKYRTGNSDQDGVYTLFFNFEDDCISVLTAAREEIGIILVDAFCDGQTWLPAVSCRGCGVSVLPPMLSM